MPQGRLPRTLLGIAFAIIAVDQALLALHYLFGGVPYIKFSSTTAATRSAFVSCTIGAVACVIAARGSFFGRSRESARERPASVDR